MVCSALKHLPGQIFGAGGLGFLDCARVEKSIEIVDDVQNILLNFGKYGSGSNLASQTMFKIDTIKIRVEDGGFQSMGPPNHHHFSIETHGSSPVRHGVLR